MVPTVKTLTKPRNARGTLFAELPVALYILIFFFTIPMLDLAAISVRSCFLYISAHMATVEAARATTFQADPVGQLSAKNLADKVAREVATGYTGVSVNSVVTSILITDTNTLNQTRSIVKLTTPADVSANTYQIEVQVSGSVQALIPFSNGPFPRMPGLNAPITLTFTDRQLCENTQGLTK